MPERVDAIAIDERDSSSRGDIEVAVDENCAHSVAALERCFRRWDM